MGLESGTYISDLNSSNPVHATDAVSEADDHIRFLKSTIKATFPNISGAVTPTHTALNFVDATSSVQTQLDNLASVKQNAATTPYTLVLTDANKHLYKTATSAYAWTVPPNSSVAFPTGTTVTMVNNAASGAITITQGSGVTIRLAGTTTSGNLTLAAYGVATLLKVDTNTWFASGAGLS